MGDQLGHHIDIQCQQIPYGMGVVGADVVLLRQIVVQHGAGLEEKLMHHDVVRHGSGSLVVHIIQAGVAAEHPLEKRPQKPFLQTGAGVRDFQ